MTRKRFTKLLNLEIPILIFSLFLFCKGCIRNPQGWWRNQELKKSWQDSGSQTTSRKVLAQDRQDPRETQMKPALRVAWKTWPLISPALPSRRPRKHTRAPVPEDAQTPQGWTGSSQERWEPDEAHRLHPQKLAMCSPSWHFPQDESCLRAVLSAGFSSSSVRIQCNATCFKKAKGWLRENSISL